MHFDAFHKQSRRKIGSFWADNDKNLLGKVIDI